MIPQNSHRRGVALILVLSFVVLATTLIVAFFSRSILHRQVASTSGSQTRVDILAQSALEIVIGDLKQEIAAGSTANTVGGITIYTPISNRTVAPYDGDINRTLQPNLLKTSAFSKAVFSGTPYASGSTATIRASNALTTGTSANQRFISLGRWNAPLLLSSTGSLFTPTNFTAPHWIIVTRGNVGIHSTGPVISGTTFLGRNTGDTGPADKGIHNPAPSNTDYAIGRFAYTVYDEGGLLDVNVAGNRLGATDNDRRGRLHQADLSVIPGFTTTGPTDLLSWRTAATGTNTDDVAGEGGLFDPKRDFIAVQKTGTNSDQTFFNRQDLIAYVKNTPSQFSDTPTGLRYPALQYLSSFSREKNAPSWAPTSPTTTNPKLADIRAKNNTPMLKQRFPLSRIDLIRLETAADVLKYFGLEKESYYWKYVHGSAINTLDQVKDLERDPNFFELLKAAILAGSLGKSGKAGTASLPESATGVLSDLQILQIGANIIDQYDIDNLPTEIRLGSEAVYGVENLPYLVRVFGVHAAIDPGDPNKINGWLQPELWNPHQQATTSGTIRLRMVGQAHTLVENDSPSQPPPSAPAPLTTADAEITFNNSSTFENPTVLTAVPGTIYSSTNSIILSGTTYVGFQTGQVDAPANHTLYKIEPEVSYSFYLDYAVGTSGYRPYSVWKNINTALENLPAAAGKHGAFFVKADPRTDRFGASVGTVYNLAAGADGEIGKTIRMTGANGMTIASHAPTSGFTWNPATNFFLGLLSDNSSTSDGYYADPDGVVRRADGANWTGAEGLPLSPASAGRAIVLNRPFRSVGELSYAFRDLPFKSLDFFTAQSADAALLDVFSVDDNEVVAGRINPNTRNKQVLQAMLLGASKSGAAPTLSSTEADALAQAIVTWTGNSAPTQGPLLNRADLVTKLETVIGGAWTADADKANKTRRESAVRALADVSNTRTWNLMIDLIAQTGRYPTGVRPQPAETDPLNKYFVVEGERRYWLHLAIDRYTGEIVDKQLELVSQ